MPHIGELLKAHLDARRARKSVLARRMGVKDPMIAKYQKRESLQTSILWRLSVELKHNFFADLAAKLPSDFTTTAPNDHIKDDEIAQLKREKEILETEKNMLLEVLRGKVQ